jgi:hypothetical protein
MSETACPATVGKKIAPGASRRGRWPEVMSDGEIRRHIKED